jgi:hypothetical protein
MAVFRRTPVARAAIGEADPGAPGVHEAVLDPAAIARLRELDPTGQARLVERVVQAYLASSQRLEVEFVEARSRGDAAGIRMVAHTLKSSSASLGALGFAATCARLESIARDEGTGISLDAAADALTRELPGVLASLRRLASPAG